MKFPARTPKAMIDTIENNSILDLEQELIEKYFQVKAWRLFPKASSVGMQLSLSFHTSDGVGIEPMPLFPEKGTEEYEKIRAHIVSFSGFLNLRIDSISEDQFQLLSTLSGKEAKPIQLYGNMRVKFNPKIYTGKDGVEREIVAINVFPDLDTFQVGKTMSYESLEGKCGKLPSSLLRS